jgi:hypothetical protein
VRRSQINAIIRNAMEFAAQCGFNLPPFAFWMAADWTAKGAAADEIRRCRLGWDVTDFGRGDFERFGLVLCTLRNGRADEPGGKCYCEKIMVVREHQMTPMHCHHKKTEDIINRAGGALVMRVMPDIPLASDTVSVTLDGVEREIDYREPIVLYPGESITLAPYLYHEFYAEPGGGRVLVGEVSSVNDDLTDNFFVEPIGRFPTIEEDEPAAYLLCSEYPEPA